MNLETQQQSLAHVLVDLIACEEEGECSWRVAEAIDYDALESRLSKAGRRSPKHLIA